MQTVTYLPHRGDRCPVHPDTVVAIDLGDGQHHVDHARHLGWGPGLGPDGEGRIHRYAVLLDAEAQARV